MGECSGAAVTKHHKLGRSELQTCVASQIWGGQSEIRVWAGHARDVCFSPQSQVRGWSPSLSTCLCACMLSRSVVSNSSATPWTVARLAPLSMGILQAGILEWVAMPSSRGSSRPRDQTRISSVSCMGRRVLYHLAPPGKPKEMLTMRNSRQWAYRCSLYPVKLPT